MDRYGEYQSNGFKKSKLTPAQRDEIANRLDNGEKPRDLAAEYKVSVVTIYNHKR